MVAWTGILASEVQEFLRTKGICISAKAEDKERLYRVELSQFITFWKTSSRAATILYLQSVPVESVDIDHSFYLPPSTTTSHRLPFAKKESMAGNFEPIDLVRLKHGRFKILSGRAQFISARNAGAARIATYVIPYTDTFATWLNIADQAAGWRSTELPVNFVCRVFAAFPSYENAVIDGKISCRQVQAELGLKSHMPVFRALKKRSQRNTTLSIPADWTPPGKRQRSKAWRPISRDGIRCIQKRPIH
ncbi:MAG: hypothetical protein QM715_13550 [Nibricoccus sp.]